MIIKNAFVYKNGKIIREDYDLSVGGVGFLSDFNNVYIFPAFCDVHVHFREPGFFYKETIIFDFTSSGSSDSSLETLIVMLI